MRHYDWLLFLEAEPFDHLILFSRRGMIVIYGNFSLPPPRGRRLAVRLILTLEELFDHGDNTDLSWIVLLDNVKFGGLLLLHSGFDHRVQVQVVDEHILLLSVNLTNKVCQLAAHIIVTQAITLLVVISGM